MVGDRVRIPEAGIVTVAGVWQNQESIPRKVYPTH